MRHEDHELIAAEPIDLLDVAGILGRILQASTHFNEELVTGRMTERVVHLLEAVEVEKRQCGRHASDFVGQQPFQLLLQGKAVGETGQLVIVSDMSQLALGPLALGNVFIGGRHSLHRAVEVIDRPGRNPDIDQRAILASSRGFHLAHRLAAKSEAEQRPGFRLLLLRHNHSALPQHLRCGVSEYLLGGPIPQDDAVIRIGARDGNRGSVDDRRERILGLAQLPFAPFKRQRHIVETASQRSAFVGRWYRCPVAEVAGGKNRRVAPKLLQRPDDTP
jgi:hypothetical protein